MEICRSEDIVWNEDKEILPLAQLYRLDTRSKIVSIMPDRMLPAALISPHEMI